MIATKGRENKTSAINEIINEIKRNESELLKYDEEMLSSGSRNRVGFESLS